MFLQESQIRIVSFDSVFFPEKEALGRFKALKRCLYAQGIPLLGAEVGMKRSGYGFAFLVICFFLVFAWYFSRCFQVSGDLFSPSQKLLFLLV